MPEMFGDDGAKINTGWVPRKSLAEVYPVSVPKPGYTFGDSTGGADLALQDAWLDARQQHPLAPHSANGAFGGAFDGLLAGLQAYDGNIAQPFRNAMPYTPAFDALMEQTIPAYQQEGFNEYESGSPVRGIAKIAAGELANQVGSFLDPTDPLNVATLGATLGGAAALKALQKARKEAKALGKLKTARDIFVAGGGR